MYLNNNKLETTLEGNDSIPIVTFFDIGFNYICEYNYDCFSKQNDVTPMYFVNEETKQLLIDYIGKRVNIYMLQSKVLKSNVKSTTIYIVKNDLILFLLFETNFHNLIKNNRC